jgi:hypothetical protein
MEVKKNVKAGKTAAPINKHNQKAARRLKVKTDIKAGLARPVLTCPIITQCQPPE